MPLLMSALGMVRFPVCSRLAALYDQLGPAKTNSNTCEWFMSISSRWNYRRRVPKAFDLHTTWVRGIMWRYCRQCPIQCMLPWTGLSRAVSGKYVEKTRRCTRWVVVNNVLGSIVRAKIELYWMLTTAAWEFVSKWYHGTSTAIMVSSENKVAGYIQ